MGDSCLGVMAPLLLGCLWCHGALLLGYLWNCVVSSLCSTARHGSSLFQNSQCTPVANEEELKTDGLVSPVNEERINHRSQE